MEKNCKVPPPIKFNCWKHHATFIKSKLQNFNSEMQLETLQSALLKIGESQMDLYYGKSSPQEIAKQTLKYLTFNSIKNKSEFSDWIRKDGKDYRIVKLKDESVWTLRRGDEESRFVHIHPGRYSPHTVRVKALTLKTAICVFAFAKIKSITELDIDLINEVRTKYLKAAPLKSVNRETGLGKLLYLFSSLN